MKTRVAAALVAIALGIALAFPALVLAWHPFTLDSGCAENENSYSWHIDANNSEDNYIFELSWEADFSPLLDTITLPSHSASFQTNRGGTVLHARFRDDHGQTASKGVDETPCTEPTATPTNTPTPTPTSTPTPTPTATLERPCQMDGIPHASGAIGTHPNDEDIFCPSPSPSATPSGTPSLVVTPPPTTTAGMSESSADYGLWIIIGILVGFSGGIVAGALFIIKRS